MSRSPTRNSRIIAMMKKMQSRRRAKA